jgi:hypothetical protein
MGVIRETVSWFAILLQFPSSQVFIARQPPTDTAQYQSEVFVRVGAYVSIPELHELVNNSNIQALETQLTALLGIAPNLNVSAIGTGGQEFRINARHTTFLIFQQQDEIASRKLLFHRQGDEFVPQAIRQTLPYFIGAIEEDRLIKINELERLRAEGDVLQKRIQEYEATLGGIENARQLLLELQQVGLADPVSAPNDRIGIETLLERALSEPSPEPPSIVDDERDSLQRERIRLLREYRNLKEDIRAAQDFEREQMGFVRQGTEQVARLRSVELFKESNTDTCPLCLSVPDTPIPNVVQLQESIDSLRRKLEPVRREVTDVRGHITQMQKDLAAIRASIDRNWTALSATTRARKQLAEQEDSYRRRSFVVGRVSLYLQSRQQLFGNEPLYESAAKIQDRIRQLEIELDKEDVQEKLNSVLNALGAEMSQSGTTLGLEYSAHPLRIDLRRLTVVADTPKGPIPLDKMGGGENWVGYHLVAFSALHHHFIREERPVPRFIMLDQPSQVHYPQDKFAGQQSTDPDEDELAVSATFKFLADFVSSLDSRFQVIVMDHADLREEFFQNAVIERWRKGEALIPASWVSGQKPPS